MPEKRTGQIGLWEAVSIGVGGMVGGGIFAVLGLAVQLARGGTPVAFALAGLIALGTAYSYARLSVTFPSQGGTVTFLNKGLGSGIFTGSMNILLWLSYVIMLALYAYAFGSYGATFFPAGQQLFWKHGLISGSILGITALNMFGADVVGRAEDWIVALKLVILALFVGIGLWGVDAARLTLSTWSPPLHLVAGGMIIFAAYEGFELIANAAQDVRSPASTLPRAFGIAVSFVVILYIAVAVVTVGNLPLNTIAKAQDYALAEAAKPFLGNWGFRLIAVAAVLSTASAINATLYGAARLSYAIARTGELPPILEKKFWNHPLEGLFLTAGLTLIAANVLNLTSIATIGSAGFLIIFALANVVNARLAQRTQNRAWLSWLAAFACGAATLALIWQTWTSSPARIGILVGLLALSFGIEVTYRSTGRTIRIFQEQGL